MYLQHIHLPNLTPYTLANGVQYLIVQNLINTHSLLSDSSRQSLPGPLPPKFLLPLPTLLTFVTPPTYTSGRRQILTPSQIANLAVGPPAAAYVHSPRGGLLTFHGPGQLTAYLIIHLRTHGLTPRCHVRFLENGLIRTLGAYGVHGFTRKEYPGVWVGDVSRNQDGKKGEKMVSVGVHVRRGVTGFGAGLNVTTDPQWWRRFAACGIEGVRMVSLKEHSTENFEVGAQWEEEVGNVLATELAKELKDVGRAQRMETDLTEALLQLGKIVEDRGTGGM